MRGLGGALAFVLALVLQPFVPGDLAGAAPPAPMTALDPALATVKQKLWTSPESPSFQLGVLADPASGRIQVFSRFGAMKHYLHFGLGSRDGGGSCVVDRWVVLDRATGGDAQVYDAARQPVTVIQRFDGAFSDWSSWYAWDRLAIEPGGWSADCATVFGTVTADPSGDREGSERTADLVPYDGPPFTASGPQAGLPRGIVTGQNAPMRVKDDLGPYSALWSVLAVPPVEVSVEIAVPAESRLQVVTPTTKTSIDPWVEPVLRADLTVRTDATDWVYPDGDVTLGGIFLDGSGYRDVRVQSPIPTDWVGSLAGAQLWSRYDGGWPPWDRHRVATYLDDEWVYIGFVGGDVPASCSEESDSPDKSGCHRYYYDGVTARLQFDEYELMRTIDPEGWQPWWQDQAFRADSRVGRITAGKQFDFKGEGELFTCGSPTIAARGCEHTYVKLVLRADGTYVYTRTEEYSEPVVRRGTYRFRSGQRLELRPRQGGTKTLNEVIALRQHGQLVDLEWRGGSLYGIG